MDDRILHRRLGSAAALPAILLVALPVLAGDRQRLAVPSPSMGRTRQALVVTPSSYRSGERRYPVIYLLHGYGSNPRRWLRVAPIAALADTHQVIFVCPDGGRVSWWLDSPVRPTVRFATHVTGEVVPQVDRSYRTIASPGGRAIAGSSMGGHGALTLLATRPELFCAAAAVSGVPDLTVCGERWDLPAVLGPLESNEGRWRAHSFAGMLVRLRGAGRTVVMIWGRDDWTAESNRRVRDLAIAEGVPVEWTEADGGHTPEFVRTQLPGVVRRLAALMQSSAGTPQAQ